MIKWFWVGIFGLGLTATATCITGTFLSDHYRLSYQHMLVVDRVAPTGDLIGGLLVLVGCIGMSFTIPGRAAIYVGMAVIALTLLPPLFLLDNPFLEIPNVHSWGIIFLLLIPLGLTGAGFLIVAGSIRLIKQRHRR